MLDVIYIPSAPETSVDRLEWVPILVQEVDAILLTEALASTGGAQ